MTWGRADREVDVEAGGETRPVVGCGARWFRGHGLGNDYLVFHAGDAWEATASSVARICDRHRGVGGDGIIVVASRSDGAFQLRGFNPDGSEFERSGNGLRVFAAAMTDEGLIGEERFHADLGGARVWLELRGPSPLGGRDVAAGMGKASLAPRDAGFDAGMLEPGGRLPVEPGVSVSCQVVSVGNPHCVVFGEDVSEETLGRLGPLITAHAAFDRGTNVQLVEVVGESRLRILIWERGVGPTTASGTSACASAAAAVTRGLLGYGRIEVEMEGGVFEVEVGAHLELVLSGPIQSVARGEKTSEFLGWLNATS